MLKKILTWKEYYFWFMQQYIDDKESIYELLKAGTGRDNLTRKEFKYLLSESLNILFYLAISESEQNDRNK